MLLACSLVSWVAFAGLGFIPRALCVLRNYSPPGPCAKPVPSLWDVLVSFYSNFFHANPMSFTSSIPTASVSNKQNSSRLTPWTCKPKHNRNLRIKNHLVHPQTGSQFLVLALRSLVLSVARLSWKSFRLLSLSFNGLCTTILRRCIFL